MNPAGLVEVNETDGIHYTEKGHAQMAELMEKQNPGNFRIEVKAQKPLDFTLVSLYY